jgi:cytochrome c553
MRQTIKAICYGLALLVSLSACNGSSPSVPAVTDQVKTIKPFVGVKMIGLYKTKCAVCHGADGAAGIYNATNLQTSRVDSMSISQILKTGKGAMPSFENELTEKEIRQIIQFVRSLRK